MKLQKETKSKKKLIIVSIVVLLLVGAAAAGFFLWQRNSTSTNNSNPTIKTQSGGKAVSDPNVPGSTLKPDGQSNNSSTAGEKEEVSDQPTISQGQTPQAPTGTFVSNHHPHLSGDPTPNTGTSTCTTSPGATCKITFTNGSITKELPAQKVDAYGNTHWDWSLQGIGLTVGTWKIKAISTNGSLSASSTDSIDLVVGQ